MADIFSMSTFEKVSIELDPVKSQTVNLLLGLLAHDQADKFRSPISGAKINIPSASEISASSCDYVSNRAQRHATCSRFVKT